MEEDLGKTHYGASLVVFDKSVPALVLLVDGIHQGASPETDITFRVLGIKSPHQVGTVQVTRCLSGYDIPFHFKILD